MFRLGAYSVETTLIRQRLNLMASILCLAFACLALKLGYMQIAQKNYYRAESERTRLRLVRIVPARGVIYDRNGEVLADTRAAFDVYIPQLSEIQILNPQPWLGNLLKMLDVKPAELLSQVSTQKHLGMPNHLLVKEDVAEEMVAYLAERMPQVIIVPNSKRQYSRMAVHALGYIDRVNENDLKSLDKEKYSSNDKVGRSGLEQSSESHLRGAVGLKAIEVNVREKAIREVLDISKVSQPKAGSPIITTIDLKLQKMAEEIMADKAGSVVAIDPRNGEIRVALSKPDYDPNRFIYGLTTSLWKELISDPKHVLQNRTIQGLYPPGSVFKIVVASTALEEGIITPHTTFSCRGRFNLGRRTWRCWKEKGHGTLNVYGALEQSCDVFFYNAGINSGVNRIHEYALKYGLGEKTRIDIKGEKAGLIPDASMRPEPDRLWSNGDTANVSIGQGLVLTTPLQVANMLAAVANGTDLYKPHLLKKVKISPTQLLEVKPEVLKKVDISQSTMDIIRQGLWGVVNGARGTARGSKVEAVQIAGKTGTSQNPHGEDHAWFIAYGPFAAPELVIAVLVENGGHGSQAAAPVAAKMFQDYYGLLHTKELTAKVSKSDSLF